MLKRESQVNLHQVPPSGGIWAPTIRCHKGRYYMTTTNRTMGGNFFVWTDDPEGDKVYYYGACENKDGTPGISMMEIDIKTGKPRSDIHFSWGYDEEHIREAGSASTRFLSCEVAGRSFTGTFVGLYASGNGREMKTPAVFSDFKMR